MSIFVQDVVWLPLGSPLSVPPFFQDNPRRSPNAVFIVLLAAIRLNRIPWAGASGMLSDALSCLQRLLTTGCNTAKVKSAALWRPTPYYPTTSKRLHRLCSSFVLFEYFLVGGLIVCIVFGFASCSQMCNQIFSLFFISQPSKSHSASMDIPSGLLQEGKQRFLCPSDSRVFHGW